MDGHVHNLFFKITLLLSTRVLQAALTSDISINSSTYTSKSDNVTGKRGLAMAKQVKWPHYISKSYEETVKHAGKAKKTSKHHRKAQQREYKRQKARQ